MSGLRISINYSTCVVRFPLTLRVTVFSNVILFIFTPFPCPCQTVHFTQSPLNKFSHNIITPSVGLFRPNCHTRSQQYVRLFRFCSQTSSLFMRVCACVSTYVQIYMYICTYVYTHISIYNYFSMFISFNSAWPFVGEFDWISKRYYLIKHNLISTLFLQLRWMLIISTCAKTFGACLLQMCLTTIF